MEDTEVALGHSAIAAAIDTLGDTISDAVAACGAEDDGPQLSPRTEAMFRIAEALSVCGKALNRIADAIDDR